MIKAKILVVDNDKDMCWLIASILREEGYSVDNAYDGESALLKINHHHDFCLWNRTYKIKSQGIRGLCLSR